MDFGKAFSYVFDDPDWLKKVGLGGVINIVPILNFAAIGYGLEVIQRVIRNDPRPLPEWDDIGGKLVKGLLVAVIGFVYMLPIIIMAICVQVVSIAIAGGASSSEDTAAMLVTVIMGCLGCLILLYSLFIGLVLPAALGNYAAKDQLGAAFRFGEVVALVQKNLGLYLMVLLITIVASLVGSLGSIACIIGVIFTEFYAALIVSHACGQAYREASASIGLI